MAACVELAKPSREKSSSCACAPNPPEARGENIQSFSDVSSKHLLVCTCVLLCTKAFHHKSLPFPVQIVLEIHSRTSPDFIGMQGKKYMHSFWYSFDHAGGAGEYNKGLKLTGDGPRLAENVALCAANILAPVQNPKKV